MDLRQVLEHYVRLSKQLEPLKSGEHFVVTWRPAYEEKLLVREFLSRQIAISFANGLFASNGVKDVFVYKKGLRDEMVGN